MTELRIAIVGAGRMGGDRARAAATLGARCVALCDPDRERAEKLRSAIRTKADDGAECAILTDPSELSKSNIDALFVCTPPFARGPWELAAIQAKIPFFVEKPVALSEDSARVIAAALTKQPVLNAVGYMNRYRPSMRPIRKALAERDVLGASCTWIGKPYRVPWWQSPELSGGPLNEQMTHLVDTLRYLLGEIVEVAGFVHAPPSSDAGATASFALRLATGGLCSILYSCAATTKMIDLQVFTTEGRVRTVDWDFHLVEGIDPSIERDHGKEVIFHREVQAFLDAVRSGSQSPILCDFHDALRTQRVVDALIRATQSEKHERIDEAQSAIG